MPHVSTDGPARPPYVNVAFRQEEIRMRRGAAAAAGCWIALSHVNTSFIVSCYVKDEYFWTQILTAFLLLL